jgi:hypothetical protein
MQLLYEDSTKSSTDFSLVLPVGDICTTHAIIGSWRLLLRPLRALCVSAFPSEISNLQIQISGALNFLRKQLGVTIPVVGMPHAYD